MSAELVDLGSRSVSHDASTTNGAILSPKSRIAWTAALANEPAVSNSAIAKNDSDTGSLKSPRSKHLRIYNLTRWTHKGKARSSVVKALKSVARSNGKRMGRRTGGHTKDEAKDQGRASQSIENVSKLDGLSASADLKDNTVSRQSSTCTGDQTSSIQPAVLGLLQDLVKRYTPRCHNSHNASTRSKHLPNRFLLVPKPKESSTRLASEVEWHEKELYVPSCDVILDNSKLPPRTDEETEPNANHVLHISKKKAWKEFKYEVVRLTHTLGITGWRRIPMDQSDEIHVERLSGALTNAVYMVSPPKTFRVSDNNEEHSRKSKPRKPQKILLRVYGAQVDHLIDREGELAILHRLSKKMIGPRLLGTFTNGRFEEYFDARPLTSEELHVPEISRWIARRMRELHDGVALLESETEAGPFVWQNIDKWMSRCEEIAQLLDRAMANGDVKGRGLMGHRHIAVSDFKLFKTALARYRAWLKAQYGSGSAIKDRLIFAHNDAQYGNILRIIPKNESCLVEATNEHKQLIVIDFEYANANVAGLEFANHFTEWCYNYHDARAPYACNLSRYPSIEEQNNFLNAYISHQPSSLSAQGRLPYHVSTTSLLTLPSILSHDAGTRSPDISGDISNPVTPGDTQTEAVQMKVERLRGETRAWRGINSAQWMMWGIIQAKFPGLVVSSNDHSSDLAERESTSERGTASTGPVTAGSGSPKLNTSQVDDFPTGTSLDETRTKDDGEEAFDYLEYAFERARFFWGDVLSLGIMRPEEVPKHVQRLAHVIDY